MLAAQRADQNDIERMRAVVEQMQNVRYQETARLSLDLEFHGLIAESSKNPVFKQMLSVFYEAIETGIILLNESEDSFNRAQKEMCIRDRFQRRTWFASTARSWICKTPRPAPVSYTHLMVFSCLHTIPQDGTPLDVECLGLHVHVDEVRDRRILQAKVSRVAEQERVEIQTEK